MLFSQQKFSCHLQANWDGRRGDVITFLSHILPERWTDADTCESIQTETPLLKNISKMSMKAIWGSEHPPPVCPLRDPCKLLGHTLDGIHRSFLMAGVSASGCPGLLFLSPAALVPELNTEKLCPAWRGTCMKWKPMVLLDMGVCSRFGASFFVADISPCLEMYMVALFMGGKLDFCLDVCIM